MINYKNSFEVFKVDTNDTYICKINCVGINEYCGYDVDSGFPIVTLDNNDIIELMFMHEIERTCKITDRVNLVIKLLDEKVI